jgi:hypothetical protein
MPAVRRNVSDESSSSLQPHSSHSTPSDRPASGGKPSSGPLRWLGSVFSRPVQLKRIGMQLHVVLAEAPSVPASSKSGGRGEALRLAHVALQDLLAQHEESRRLAPHLAHLEQTLARQGSRALKVLPVNVLSKALDQLDRLEGTARSDDLMVLRLRVEEAVKRRTPARLRDDVSSIEVTEASHSQFDEADRRWTAAAPLDDAEVLQPAK